MTRQKLVMLRHIKWGKLADLVGNQRLRERLTESEDTPIETIERARVEAERKLLLVLRKRYDEHVRKLEEALDRFNHNTYGICLDCGKAICDR
jgi:RNA polymerase-binding transcription factor DksA